MLKLLWNRSEKRSAFTRAEHDAFEIGKLVKAAGQDVPSLSWRSTLNERLLAEASAQRVRKVRTRVLFGSVASAATASLALFTMMSAQMTKPSMTNAAADNSFERSLISMHQEVATLGSVAATGLIYGDSESTSRPTDRESSDSNILEADYL